MTDQTVNIPLLRKAVEWAEAEAARPDGAWKQWAVAETAPTHCGTAFCVAGWTLHEAGWTLAEIQGDGALETAADMLGIPSWRESCLEGTDHLFDGQHRIEDIRRIAEELAGERL